MNFLVVPCNLASLKGVQKAQLIEMAYLVSDSEVLLAVKCHFKLQFSTFI